MKLMIAAATTLAMLCSTVVSGQTQGDKPYPPATTTPMAQPDVPQADMKLVTGNSRRSRVDADARHCLDLPTNVQIIRCAEKYR